MLRFHAYWDDTGALFGDVRLYQLSYYLADDTLEVVEVLPRNCGRNPFPRFLRRMRLPKHVPAIGAPPRSDSVESCGKSCCTCVASFQAI